MAVGDVLAALQMADRVREAFPFYEEETTVNVQGNANSKIADLFNQAVAIAFGQTKNVFLAETTTPFVADAQYDMMHKSVTVTLRYTQAGIASQNPVTGAAAIAGTSVFNDRFFNEPPDDNLSAGKPNNVWFNLSINNGGNQGLKNAVENNAFVAMGDPATIAASNSPKANWIPGNGLGVTNSGVRGTFLERLVYSALASDCQVTDTYQQIRNRPLTYQPGTPTVNPGDSSLSNSPYTITALANTIYSSLMTETEEQPPDQMLNSMVSVFQNTLSSGGG